MNYTYKLTGNDSEGNRIKCIKRTVNGHSDFIPEDPANTDYQEYLEWVAAGNTADPAS